MTGCETCKYDGCKSRECDDCIERGRYEPSDGEKLCQAEQREKVLMEALEIIDGVSPSIYISAIAREALARVQSMKDVDISHNS
jgi:hypothetical protein